MPYCHPCTMPPKGSKKTLIDAPIATDPSPPPVDPAMGKSDRNNVLSPGKIQDHPAGSSGLFVAKKAASSKLQDESCMDDESDDELEIDFLCDLLTRIRYTAILMVPFFLEPDLGAVISSVRMLLKRVWSFALSPGAADGAKIQTLRPAFVAKTKYCCLQLSLLHEEDIEMVHQKVVDYQRSGNSKKCQRSIDDPRLIIGKGYMLVVLGGDGRTDPLHKQALLSQCAFKRYKLLKIAMGEEKTPEEGNARDRWIEKSAVLYELILQSVNNDMFQHIKDLVELDDSGPKAWKLLRNVIQPNMLPMVIVLEKELAALSMRPDDDVKPVLDKIKDTYARMAAAGSNVSQMHRFCRRTSAGTTQVVVLPTKLLRGMELQEAAEEEGEGEAEAVGEALAEGEAEVTIARGMGALCFNRPKGWAPPGMKPPSGERARGGAVQGSSAQGDSAHGKADPGMFLMVEDVKGSEGDVGSVGKVVMHPLTHWVIDSGCTSQMTPRADLLDEVKPPGNIKFVAAASGALLPVIGVGNAKKVQQPQQPHGEVLAGVDASAAWAKASSGSGEADWETWHERLCHVNFPMLQKLVKDGSLKGLEVKGAVKEIGSCPTCLETKFTKFPFRSGTGPAKAPLALVHMDVVGPTRAPSLSGSRYFLTIVDDHTRAVWVYPLNNKGEVAASVLKEWMPRAQRESGHKVKVIRTDNGGEFIGADFEAVLKKKGIQHQLTVPYNPQQNGVAERFNRTLQEGARTLLGRAGLSDPFWVTALRHVALVKNRVLATVGDKQRVPYTKWYGSAPADSMLRAYGCMVVFHVPKEKRGKLEASGRWGEHLGLAKDHKGWLIWDLKSQQLTMSRDVKFLESLYYKEWKQQQKLPTTPLIIEVDEVQRPSRQVQVTVSDEEISGVTEDGGEPEVEEQQQQQQDAPPCTQRPPYRPRRDVRPPNWLTYHSFGKPKVVRAGSVVEQCDEDEIAHCYWAAVPEPKMLAEALSGPDAEKWKQSVKEEYDSLLENETWELCELPPGKKAISSKLIFRHKYGLDGELTRYKSRLVAKGFQQTKGKDFDEIFTPVGKGTTLRRPDKGVLRLHQRKYYEGLAEKYGLQDGGKPATPLSSGFTVEPCADEEVVGESDRKLFHSTVGALNYAANHTRPEIAFATSRLASVVSRPSHEQLEVAKRLVCYVSATASVGLEYSAVRQRQQRGAADLGKGEMLFTCYTDASFNSVKADGTSIGGYVCLFGGGAVSWRSKKQNEVGLSSCETEYMALHHGVKEVVWLRRLLEEIGVCEREPTMMFSDNESAMKLAKNACLHGLTKHIRPKWHWVRRLLDKEVQLEIVKIQQQAAYIFTKRLAENEHWKGMKLAGMSVH
ncbi:unnamed protein product [Closterium sp. NIES-53]